MFLSIGMLKLNYFLADIFILSAEKQPIKLSWRKIEWLLYKGKIFIIKLLYPMLYIKEKGTRAVMGIRINASRKMLE